jgi:hypothetical protein
VFDMVDTSQQPALGYMEVVQQRDALTLLPIIQAHTAPGTTIHSDQWAAYSPGIAAHNTVNHSLNFVDPVTGRIHVAGTLWPHGSTSLIADIAQQYPV